MKRKERMCWYIERGILKEFVEFYSTFQIHKQTKLNVRRYGRICL